MTLAMSLLIVSSAHSAMRSFVVFILSASASLYIAIIPIFNGYDVTNNSIIVTHGHEHGDRRLSSLSSRWNAGVYNDPRTVELKEVTRNIGLSPLQICNRKAPISHEFDVEINDKYRQECNHNNNKLEETSILLLHERKAFGRTGNNLIEFLHALQYARNNNLLLVITSGCWIPHLLTNMWLAIQIDNPTVDKQSPLRSEAMEQWTNLIEQLFCIKIITTTNSGSVDEIDTLVLQLSKQYANVIQMSTKELFLVFRTNINNPTVLDDYIDYQCYILRTLYRRYNTGFGVNMRNMPVKDMCSAIDATVGSTTATTTTTTTASSSTAAIYSVIHSRSLEGEPGIRILEKISRRSGCDTLGALLMEPEYIISILEPLNMLHYPILFITDHQNPDIYNKLLANPIIGRNIQLIPEDSSWIGGDITVASMANVFIGNPASTFSGFIAKTRIALGYDSSTTVMFRAKDKTSGDWVTVCEDKCIFETQIMNAMA